MVNPTTPFDYIGLFNSAMRILDPVLIVEHHELYPLAGSVPKDNLDYLVPMDQAKVRREGSDITVIAYLSLVPRVLRIAEALAEQEGMNVEVIDLLTLDYANIAFDTIGQSVSKTGITVVVEEAIATQCLGPCLAYRLHQRYKEQLKQLVMLVSSQRAPMPVSKVLEESLLISDEQIRQLVGDAAVFATRLDHLAVTVSDMDGALPFYCGLLGLRQDSEDGLEGQTISRMTGKQWVRMKVVRLICPQTPQITIDIQQYLEPQSRVPDSKLGDVRNTHFCVEVDDIHKTYSELKAKGVQFVSESVYCDLEHDCKLGVVFFLDPDGNVLELADYPNEKA